MNNTSRSSFLTLLLLLTLLYGCESSSSALIPTRTELPNSVPTATLTPSLQPNITATVTPFLPTPIPGLSVAEADARLQDYLQNGPNCRLPCWLGITSGQSSMSDIETQLILLSSIIVDRSIRTPTKNWSVSSATILYSSKNIVTEIRSGYLASLGYSANEDTKISVIEFSTRAYEIQDGNYTGDSFGNSFYNKLLESYSLSSILSEFGQPDQIYVESYLRGDTKITPGFGDHFDLHIWYPSRGIFLGYKMSVEGSGKNYRFCPSNAFIFGDLVPTDVGTNYQEVLIKLGSKYEYFFSPSLYIKKPEEAFGMTIDELYQVFLSTPNRCLETPISLWYLKNK